MVGRTGYPGTRLTASTRSVGTSRAIIRYAHPFGVLMEEEPCVSQRRHTRSKASRGIVTRTIRYQDRRNPPGRPQTLKVDLRRGEHLDAEYAAALVAARAGVPLAQVTVLEIVQSPPSPGRSPV
jgi:hypothetical protein